MHLHAAIVPPAHLLAEAADVVRDGGGAGGKGGARDVRGAEVTRGLFGRRRVAEPVAGRPSPFELIDPALVLLPITSFGKVTPEDARRIAAAVTEAVAVLERPVVRLQGGVALEPVGDDRIWVRLAGDGSGDGELVLRAVPRTVLSAVERVGFFCDRRVFAPLLPLARVNDATTEADLVAVLARLEAYRSEPWEIDHLSLLQRPSDPRRQPSREVERIAFR